MKYFLGLGSNMGDKSSHLHAAQKKISQIPDCMITQKSSIIQTKPWGYQAQDDFLNMVIVVETTYEPLDLLLLLHDIEVQMGRTRNLKWGPRIIDIDILLCDDRVEESQHLSIPHPQMHKRDFVLTSMCEIASDLRHPVLGHSMAELRKGLHTANSPL
jgi:2-amino-4-hydroxy-6-hydroxymethyldihydropteridine diphosphokinase